MKKYKDESGFTLVEMIAVLIILSLVAIVLSNAIVYGIQAYIFARNADQLSQKAQLALARISSELTDITAVSFASADRIDYTLAQSTAPSCASPAGCQYSMKRTGNQITLERITTPAITAQVLIDGLAANNGGNNLLGYFQSGGGTWIATNAFNTLATIRVQISLDFTGGNPLYYQGTINPRANGILIAPRPD
jgi:prepilin-type N-terminal cleavage/methylation domain-containing protein